MRNDEYLTQPKVRRRYGVSDMTVWRWVHDSRLGFPQPIQIGRRNYFKLSELEEFERKQVLNSNKTSTR